MAIKTASAQFVKKVNISEANTYMPVNNWPSIPAFQWYIKKYNMVPHSYDFGECVYSKVKSILEKSDMVMSKSYHLSKRENKAYSALFIVNEKKGIAIYMPSCEYREKENLSLCHIDILFQEYDSEVEKLINKIGAAIYKKEKVGVLNLLSKTNDGFELKEFPISCPEIDFNANYNEDFKEINDLILTRLRQDNGKGIVMLYGPPGTGKTSYIRYVINSVDKRIIYMPPDMTTELSNPGLIPFLTKVPNSILIVEDAENVLIKRQGQHSQAISNILNLSDGLLSDCLNIQIIATFNTNLKNIDEALMRKGRLIAKYEFGQLSSDRTKTLMKKLGVKFTKNNSSLTLAEVYNMQEKEFTPNKKPIGFEVNSKEETIA